LWVYLRAGYEVLSVLGTEWLSLSIGLGLRCSVCIHIGIHLLYKDNAMMKIDREVTINNPNKVWLRITPMLSWSSLLHQSII